MPQCSIYDNSLRFSRTIYGLLALIAFLIQSPWLVLAISILMTLGAVSVKYNLLYQFHSLVLRKLLKDKSEPIKKESAELSFACGLAATFLFLSFLFLYFGKAVGLAWTLVLMVSGLMLLAGIAGVCMASLMYVIFQKIFKR